VTSEAASQQILVDVMQCLWWALPLGMLAHQWFGERVVSLAGWDGRPRPGTPVDFVDMLVALALMYALGWPVAAGQAGGSDAGRDLRPADVVVSVGMGVFLWGMVLVYLRGWRQRGLTAWLGLPDARRMVSLVPVALIWTILGGALVYALAGVADSWLWEPLGFEAEAQPAVRALTESRSMVLRGLLVVAACVVAPVVEETVFRGFLYPTLRQFTDAPFAAVFSSVLFGLVHGSLSTLVPLAVFGVILVMAYEWSRGLALPIAMHALFNLATTVVAWLHETRPVP